MNNPHKYKKKITQKKWNTLLKIQQEISQNKNYTPGILKFSQLQNCQSRLVNFFGNVHSEVFSLKVNRNDTLVGAACSNGQVRIYDIYQGQLLNTNNTSRLSGYPCTGFKWKPKHQREYFSCNCDGTIRWYKMDQEIPIGHYQTQNHGYLSCDYQVQQEWVGCGTDKGQIQIFDNQTMKLMHTYYGHFDKIQGNQANRVFSVKCLKEDKNIFFSGGWDSTIQIYDIRVEKYSVRKFYGPLISADSLDYKDGMVLAGNYRNSDFLQLWDFKSGKLIQTLDVNQPENGGSYCFGAAFAQKSQKNIIGAAMSGSNKVKILKDKVLSTQVQLQAAPLALDFYRFQNKDFMLIAGIQGTIYVVKLKFKETLN